MRTIRKFSIILILILSFDSCTYEEVEITDIKYVKLVEFSQKGLVVESEIKIKNPNGFQLSMVDSEFDIYIKGSKLAKANVDNNIRIPKNSEEYHKVMMKSNFEDFADGAMIRLLGLTLGSKEIDFKVDGYVTGRAFFIKKKVRVSHEAKVPLKLD
ncbi:LEA type 2 family protein [Vicingaceae bacterium]|nr:LEA type 2 family protein [Vicingaceae bacterium]MDB4060842.1 LEA type 2 family protein [Vicingaceae bacterium]